jgi:formyl-CoA transferase
LSVQAADLPMYSASESFEASRKHVTELWCNMPRRGGHSLSAALLLAGLQDRVRAPEFGEQTEEVLAEFGFGSDEIADLRQHKVVWRHARISSLRQQKAPEQPGLSAFP